jgi:4,5-DOPA dioxygenase extradiol
MNQISSSIAFISHGGGPLPLLGDEAHQELITNLQKLPTMIKKPSSILVISAHWEEDQPTITIGKSPPLVYDYYGFPKEAYEIQYLAQGNPILAYKVHALLVRSGLDARLDEQRGFDHGVFVPLKIMYPDADIPCIQLSLVKGLDPAEHIRIGKALNPLLEDDILIIGSGFSFHNLSAFFTPNTKASQTQNEAFEQWLIHTCTNHQLNEEEREHRLVNWENAPAARYCHPREEHLIPLHICYGIAGTAARQSFSFEIMGKKASAYLWS